MSEDKFTAQHSTAAQQVEQERVSTADTIFNVLRATQAGPVDEDRVRALSDAYVAVYPPTSPRATKPTR